MRECHPGCGAPSEGPRHYRSKGGAGAAQVSVHRPRLPQPQDSPALGRSLLRIQVCDPTLGHLSFHFIPFSLSPHSLTVFLVSPLFLPPSISLHSLPASCSFSFCLRISPSLPSSLSLFLSPLPSLPSSLHSSLSFSFCLSLPSVFLSLYSSIFTSFLSIPLFLALASFSVSPSSFHPPFLCLFLLSLFLSFSLFSCFSLCILSRFYFPLFLPYFHSLCTSLIFKISFPSFLPMSLSPPVFSFSFSSLSSFLHFCFPI